MSTKQEFIANYIINTFELETSVEDVIKILKKGNKEFNKQNPKKATAYQYFCFNIASTDKNVLAVEGIFKTHAASKLWNKLTDNKKQEYKDKAEGWTKPKKEKIIKKKCVAKTKSGNPCKNNALKDSENCKQHSSNSDASSSDSESKICEGTTAKGEPCKSKAKKGEDYCNRHLESGKDESKIDEKRPNRKNKNSQIESEEEKVIETEVEMESEPELDITSSGGASLRDNIEDIEEEKVMETVLESDEDEEIEEKNVCKYVYKRPNKTLGKEKGDMCGIENCPKHNK